MKTTLSHLFLHGTLSREDAKARLMEISEGKYSPFQVAAFLTTFMMRNVTVDELNGFRDALLEKCVRIDLSAYNPMDLCGTGGDGQNTFNISTLAAVVTAGAGIPVAKHGNYGVSSLCGSSNVLEHLGIQFTNEEAKLQQQMEEAGLCFLHAPLFHPAMKEVAPIRKGLGMRTFFNMLGPMVNPSFPKRQLVGVYHLELARLLAYLCQENEVEYVILHDLNGYDEVSLTGEAKIFTNTTERMLAPDTFGFEQTKPEELFGGDSIADAAHIFEQVLRGEGTEAQEAVVCANAALAIHCGYPEVSIENAADLARESLRSGRALRTFEKLLSLQS